ncbi:MAG: AAA family ATPase [Deltaproteobacteria bacterium]|jgi:AAA15 family ATPase/GTPase|nr:AAA family ATPase [Deltaproteobacteria bacterium]
MFTKIDLKNFKCFSEFSIDNFRQITLISGANNAGKTTLLEAIHLAYSSLIPNIFFDINITRYNREIVYSPMFLWEHLFSKTNTNSSIIISTNEKDSTNQVKIFKKALSNTFFNETHKISPIIRLDRLNNYSLVCEHTLENETKEGIYTANENCITLNTPYNNFANKIFSVYLPANSQFKIDILLNWFDYLQLNGKKANLISILKKIDSNICDIFVINQSEKPSIICYSDNIGSLPLKSLGGGLNRLFLYALAIISNPNSIILIDEIDNSYRYDFIKDFWTIIIELAVDYNCQIIATTHSYECINGAFDASKSFENKYLSFIRIDNNDQIPRAVSYTDDDLEFAVKRNFEIR